MASSDEIKLPMLAEKALPNAIHPHLTAYCSRTDLLAVVNLEETVDVYRLGGQRAFSVKKRSQSGKVVGLHWIRDGKCLIIAFDTGTTDIVSGETGKLVRHGGEDPFTSNALDQRPSPASITCLGWGTTATQGSKSAFRGLNKSETTSAKDAAEATTEDWYDELQGDTTAGLLGDDVNGSESLLNDLPHQLASVDIDSVLPRLSAIPPRANAGGLYDMFTTQVALDDYFTSLQRSNTQSADVMLVGHQDGLVKLVVDDILEISLPRKDGRRASGPLRAPLQHASCLQSPRHGLLRADRSDEETASYRNLSFSLFDIPLMSLGGSHLHIIVSKTAQIRDLCNYITYGILCVEADWKTYTNLPSRFIENINETLEEKHEGTLEQNLFHLAMTGNFTPTILEWLRDELAERGHKRWDLATSSLHADLSKLFQTNLLPALERCIVVATSLRGLATYYEGSKKFNVAPSFFTAIIDALCMLQLVIHEAVQILVEEQRQFRAFSKWLRHVIDLAAADPTSVSAKDMAEREAHNLDIPPVLAYLEGALMKSKLKPIVFAQAETETGTDLSQEELVKAIQRARITDDDDAEASGILSLGQLRQHLVTVCQDAHMQILRWQNSAVPNIETVDLAIGPVTGIIDMQMLNPSPQTFTSLILTVPINAQNTITLTTIPHTSPLPSPSSPNSKTILTPTTRTLALPPTIKILSASFTHTSTRTTNTNLILLVATHNQADEATPQHHLLHIPITAAVTNPSTDPSTPTTTEIQPENHTIHTFPPTDAFVPSTMTLSSGPQGSARQTRTAAAVVVVIAANGRQWRVLDLGGLEDGGAGVGAGVGVGNGDGKSDGNGDGRGDGIPEIDQDEEMMAELSDDDDDDDGANMDESSGWI